MNTKVPTFPGAMLDLKEDAAYAMLSDAVYGDHADLVAARDGKSAEYELPERWSLLGAVESLQRDNFEDDRGTGLTVAAFEKQNDPERRIVLAFRGSDERQDWTGPNIQLAADGDLLGAMGLPGPKTKHTEQQLGDAQRFVAGYSSRGGDDWDPQIEAALNYALAMHRKYGANHKIEVTGHSLGGAHAQVVAHTFGWGGRTFDAPGAKNIIESPLYRQWCQRNGVTPPGAPAYEHGTVQQASLLNYTVNNSAVSARTGDHIGPKLSISSLAGRQGVLEHGQWAVGLVGGAIAETPLFDQTLGRTMGAGAKWVEYLSKGAAIGADANERHDMSRISRAFQEDVANGRTLPRQYGDAEPVLGDDRRLARDPSQPAHPDHEMLEQIRRGMRTIDAGIGKPYDEASERISRCLLAACKDNREMYPGREVSLSANALTRVDHVAMGRNGHVFAVEGRLDDPASKRVCVSAEQALNTPIEQSDQKLAAANQTIAQEQERERALAQSQQRSGPSLG